MIVTTATGDSVTSQSVSNNQGDEKNKSGNVGEISNSFSSVTNTLLSCTLYSTSNKTPSAAETNANTIKSPIQTPNTDSVSGTDKTGTTSNRSVWDFVTNVRHAVADGVGNAVAGAKKVVADIQDTVTDVQNFIGLINGSPEDTSSNQEIIIQDLVSQYRSEVLKKYTGGAQDIKLQDLTINSTLELCNEINEKLLITNNSKGNNFPELVKDVIKCEQFAKYFEIREGRPFQLQLKGSNNSESTPQAKAFQRVLQNYLEGDPKRADTLIKLFQQVNIQMSTGAVIINDEGHYKVKINSFPADKEAAAGVFTDLLKGRKKGSALCEKIEGLLKEPLFAGLLKFKHPSLNFTEVVAIDEVAEKLKANVHVMDELLDLISEHVPNIKDRREIDLPKMPTGDNVEELKTYLSQQRDLLLDKKSHQNLKQSSWSVEGIARYFRELFTGRTATKATFFGEKYRDPAETLDGIINSFQKDVEMSNVPYKNKMLKSTRYQKVLKGLKNLRDIAERYKNFKLSEKENLESSDNERIDTLFRYAIGATLMKIQRETYRKDHSKLIRNTAIAGGASIAISMPLFMLAAPVGIPVLLLGLIGSAIYYKFSQSELISTPLTQLVENNMMKLVDEEEYKKISSEMPLSFLERTQERTKKFLLKWVVSKFSTYMQLNQ